MKKNLLQFGMVCGLVIMATGAFAQAPGSSEAIGGTIGVDVYSTATGNTTASASETLYIGPGNYLINGTWEIYSKNVWISPDAVITGSGTIKFFNPSVAGGAASATLIDGNNNASFINVNIELQNAGNMILTDIAGPGAPWTDVASNANLTIGADFNFSVANGDVLIGNYDMITATAATLTNYQPDRFVVTYGTGHLLHNSYSGAFIFPVGMTEGDYTPASVNNAAANTVHVLVQNYANSAPMEINSNGIDRTWNIYADNAATGAVIDLQHNLSSNDPNYVDASCFVTQYSSATPNLSGQTTTSTTAWQSNNQAAGTGTGTLTTGSTVSGASERSLAYTSLATSAAASEAFFTKSSSANAPLPLTLISFTGKPVNCTVVLKWITAAESNLRHYELQRSTDGSNYETIAQVAPKGSNSSYTYTDNSITGGSLFYRLYIAELDGKNHYSNTAQVYTDCNDRSGISVFPNPASDMVTVKGLESGEDLYITDVKGSVVKRILYSSNVQILDIGRLAAGVYTVQVVKGGNALKAIKFVKN